MQRQQPVPNYRMSDIAETENEPVFHPVSSTNRSNTAAPVNLEDEPLYTAEGNNEHVGDEQPLLS